MEHPLDKKQLHFGTLRINSVQGQFAIVLILASLLPVAGAEIVLYNQRSDALRAMALENLETIRDFKVQFVKKWIGEIQNDLTLVGHDEDILALEGMAPHDFESRPIKEQRALTRVQLDLIRLVDVHRSYTRIDVVMTDGTVICSSLPGTQLKLDRHAHAIRKVFRSEKPHASEIYRGRTGEISMSVMAPLTCLAHHGKHVFAVLIASIDLKRTLYPLMLRQTGLGATGETLIVGRDGLALNPLRWNAEAALSMKITAAPTVRAARGKTGTVTSLDYRGKRVLAAYTHIPELNWGFVAKKDLAEVDAPVQQMLHDMLSVFALTGLISMAVSVWLGHKLATPLLSLSETARKISSGDLGARCEHTLNNEIGDLGLSFNRMAETVQQKIAGQAAIAEVASTALKANTIEDFALGTLTVLMALTRSISGAFYLRNEESGMYQCLYTAGETRSDAKFGSKSLEIDRGFSLAKNAISYVRDLPPDAMLATEHGGPKLRELVRIPLVTPSGAGGLLSLATLHQYSEVHGRHLAEVQDSMNIALSRLIAEQEVREFASTLEGLNKSLAAKNSEFESQAERLRGQRVEIDRADQLKTEFLANMTHELRTPLNSVLALSQLLASRGIGAEPESDRKCLEVIERNGQQLLLLLENILDLSKIESGYEAPELGDVDVAEIATHAMDEMRPVAELKGLEAHLKLPISLPLLRSDPRLLKRILLNLLSNAINYTDNGTVELAVENRRHEIAMIVTDTGIGIPESEREGIFDQFRQLDGTITRRQGGAGLGLAISRRLAHLLGGDISVASGAQPGSVFTLTLRRMTQ